MRRAAALLAPACGALVLACARQEAPPGGTPDRIPPAVVAVAPEALSEADALDRPIRIQFNETISERTSSGTLDDAVLVSPEAPGARVRHRGDALEVELPGGLTPGVVYRVTVRPVVRDRFGNVMGDAFEFVFSTGGELHPTAVAGLVVERESGRAVRDARVQAVDSAAAPDVVHVARTDSAGLFALRYLPPGSYALSAYVDQNRSGLREPSEAGAAAAFTLAAADTTFVDLAVMAPDSVPARITDAEVLEPDLVRVTFDDFLDPDEPLARLGASLRQGEGGEAPEVRQILHEHRMIALRASAIEAATSDTLPDPPPPRIDFRGRAQSPDSVALAALGLTVPSRVIFVQLSDTLAWDTPYELLLQGALDLDGLTTPLDTVDVDRGAAPAAPAAPPPGPPPLR